MRTHRRYEVVRRLGSGAPGGVFLVRDRVRGETLALKRLHARADELLRASFEREFTVLAGLSLPGVSRVMDFGLSEPEGSDPGGPFFTRSFIDGDPLDVALTGESPAVIATVMAEVCAIVEPLHRIGISHGDLKPANIIRDGSGRPHVIDFGLARVSYDSVGQRGSGTPAYMAPELLRGEVSSAAADVYALGATIFKLVTGHAPLEEQGDRGLAARLAGELPRSDDAGPDATPLLEVALKAIAPDPLERLPAVGELRAALQELLPGAGPEVVGGWVTPKPRGHEDVLAQLDVKVSKRLSRGSGEQAALVVAGEAGAGKSTLLRELTWRLQVRGIRVIEVGPSSGDALGPLRAIAAQAAAYGVEGEALPSDTHTADALVEAFIRGLQEVAASGPTVLLVEDLDMTEPVVGRALRSALHASGCEEVALVATARDRHAAALTELGAKHVISVPALDVPDVAALVADTLGAVDAGVVRALHKKTRGIPGAIVEGLATLRDQGTPTQKDIKALRIHAGESASRARLAAIGAEGRPLVETIAVAPVPVPELLVRDLLGIDEAQVQRALSSGLLERVGGDLVLADRGLAAVIGDDLTAEEAEARVRAIADHPRAKTLPLAHRAQLAVAGDDGEGILALAFDGALELQALGATTGAIALLEAFAKRVSSQEAQPALLLLSRLHYDLGRYQDASAVAREAMAASKEPDYVAEAAIVAGRALVSAGDYDAAMDVLGSIGGDVSAKFQAVALRERSKAALARGDYDGAESAAIAGLERAESDDPVRVELLTSAGLVATYRGDHETARGRYQEALTLAHATGSRRDEARVFTCLAIDHQRAGDYKKARELHTRSLEVARELDDIGSMATFSLNLGTINQIMGEPSVAASHYETAAKLARRAGRAPTDVVARCNLANLHIYLGLYERARIEADEAFHDAEESGMRAAAAQATGLLGDVAARSGDVDAALTRYDDAIGRYRSLQQDREVAEILLDSAECLLDRNGPADTSAAVSRLAEARTIFEEEKIEDLSGLLRILVARARAETGDPDGAVGELEDVLGEARRAGDRELEWQALASLGLMNAMRGADFVSRRQDQEAMEVLESIATRLPRDHREAFWHDPRRRVVRVRLSANQMGQSALSVSRLTMGESTFQRAGLEARAARLLELIKRLASERDVDRLLERITDSAVELAGAERGFVLLVQEDGSLEARTIRDAGTNPADPHVAFSQSIAEAVLIDGEPIVTIDAGDDSRLSEYMSVHKLMLKSVACLPIRGRSGTVGVLYLEHRMRRGRFDEGDVDLLFAFADQAAIALENARLISENERRRAELEAANAELAEAKAQIERVLVARTAQLEAAKQEVDHARQQLRGSYSRHGIVGASDAMRRVFAIIDRVRETSVSVVIQGESGTGKELVARAIHYAGPRAKGPFVAVNCAAIPDALLESELFGHVRGAFTGADRDRQGVLAQASTGTLFLDEVGDMPPKMQVDLLRVLQDRKVRPVGGQEEQEVDVRVISASNKSLTKLVENNEFREDLFYRLNVVEIRLPPLRERRGDIPRLTDFFLGRFAKRDGAPPKRLSKDAQRRLGEHSLPGNVRQLEHVLLNAWVMVEGEIIEADDLALEEGHTTVRLVPTPATSERPPQTYGDFKADEKQRILAALEEHNWNRVQAAKALEMPRRTFYRRLKEYDIL
ncbi:MAG: sigma 54-interacting transcriptional regulator [Myxococcota bacterium]